MTNIINNVSDTMYYIIVTSAIITVILFSSLFVVRYYRKKIKNKKKELLIKQAKRELITIIVINKNKMVKNMETNNRQAGIDPVDLLTHYKNIYDSMMFNTEFMLYYRKYVVLNKLYLPNRLKHLKDGKLNTFIIIEFSALMESIAFSIIQKEMRNRVHKYQKTKFSGILAEEECNGNDDNADEVYEAFFCHRPTKFKKGDFVLYKNQKAFIVRVPYSDYELDTNSIGGKYEIVLDRSGIIKQCNYRDLKLDLELPKNYFHE